MKFTDFRMRDLVGKAVVWTVGGEGKGTQRTVTKIKSTLSEGFVIEAEDRLFNYYNGRQRATTGRMDWTESYCQLISETQIDQLRKEWKVTQKKQLLIQSIKENLKNLDFLEVNQLEQLEQKLKQ